MSTTPHSIPEYLQQLRAALEGADPALIQDALYDAEEYLRAELAAHPDQTEAEALDRIVGNYGTPEEVAAAYRDNESKMSPGLPPAPPREPSANPLKRFFGIYLDPRAYTSLFFMLLALVTGTVYFTFAMSGLSLSLGLSILIIGVPVFLVFIAIARVIALGEGRLIEAVSGERMPRRPVHPGPPRGWLERIGDMLGDLRTWTTLAYLLVMLPLGILYFLIAVLGLGLGFAFVAMGPIALSERFGLWHSSALVVSDSSEWQVFGHWPHSTVGLIAAAILCTLLGVLLVTGMLHLARGIGRLHAAMAKSLLVKP